MHSWLRGPKIPPILPTSPSPFSNFVPTPFPTSLLPPTAPPHTHNWCSLTMFSTPVGNPAPTAYSVVLFLWPNG